MKKTLKTITLLILLGCISLSFHSMLSAQSSDLFFANKQRELEIAANSYFLGVQNKEFESLPINIIIDVDDDVDYDYVSNTVYFEDPENSDNIVEFEYTVRSVNFDEVIYAVNVSLKNGYNQAVLRFYDHNSPKTEAGCYLLSGSNNVPVVLKLNTAYYMSIDVDGNKYLGSIKLNTNKYNKIIPDVMFTKITKNTSSAIPPLYQKTAIFSSAIVDDNIVTHYIVQNLKNVNRYTYVPKVSGVLSVNVSSSEDCDVYIYDSYDNLIAVGEAYGDDYVSAYVDKGLSYYVDIKNVGENETDAEVAYSISPAYRWFRQYPWSSSSNYGTWLNTKLDKVYFPNVTTVQYKNAPFLSIYDSSINGHDSLKHTACHMDKGCFMACWAMLLRNNSSTEYLNNIYDMRVSDTILFSSVYTDPFTVMLAQWELTDTLPSSVYNSSVDRYNLTTVTASYATYTNRYSIADYYGVRSNLREYTFSSSQTEADKILIIADALEDSWSGIIVNFNSAHYLVITEDRGAQYTNLKERYIAFDPASVLDYNYLGHTWAELESSYDFDDITKIYYFAD